MKVLTEDLEAKHQKINEPSTQIQQLRNKRKELINEYQQVKTQYLNDVAVHQQLTAALQKLQHNTEQNNWGATNFGFQDVGLMPENTFDQSGWTRTAELPILRRQMSMGLSGGTMSGTMTPSAFDFNEEEEVDVAWVNPSGPHTPSEPANTSFFEMQEATGRPKHSTSPKKKKGDTLRTKKDKGDKKEDKGDKKGKEEKAKKESRHKTKTSRD